MTIFKTPSNAHRLPCVWLLACASVASHGGALAAEDAPGSHVHFDAFGTLGAAWSELDEPRYLTHQSDTKGLSTNPTGRPDTRLGMQLGWTLNDQVEINVQGLISDYRNEDKAQISWAYVRAQITPDWDIKIGRFRLPVYMYADTLDVGYAYPWVRPPVDVYYTSADFHSADGVMLHYKHPLESGYWQIEPFVGYVDDVAGTQTQVQFTQLGVAGTWVHGQTEVFGAITSTRNSIYSPRYQRLVDACYQLGYGACSDYDLRNLRATQISLGVRRDDNHWMFAGELTHIAPSSLTASKQWAGFVSAGHYFGTWLPYVTYSQLSSSGPTQETRLGPLNPIFTAVLQNKAQQHTWSLGTRWDVRPGIALKAQIDNVHPDHGSPGTFTSPLPAGTGSANVYSLTLDWTY